MNNPFNAFAKSLKALLQLAEHESHLEGNTTVETHHILLAMLQMPDTIAGRMLLNFGITIDILRPLQHNLSKNESDKKQVLSSYVVQMLQYASDLALEYGSKKVDTEHVLYALCTQNNTSAIMLLRPMMLNPDTIKEEIKTLLMSNNGSTTAQSKNVKDMDELFNGLAETMKDMINTENTENNGTDMQQKEHRTARKNTKKSALDYFCTDFTALAEEGKLDVMIGRDAELERLIHILARRRKNNPMLLGDPGVGKTAVVEMLARAIIEEKVPDSLMDKRVLSLSMTNLVAGTKYRGEFEERMRRIVDEAISGENDVILFIDEFHTIVGAGSAEGTLDAANILKPALSRGELQIIGATTIDEYRKHVEKDAALARRFQALDIQEPRIDVAIDMLNLALPAYEEYHNIRFEEGVSKAAVELSSRYISDRYLPDKAFDLLDEAAASKAVLITGNGKKIKALRTELKKLADGREKAVQDTKYDIAEDLETRIEEIKKRIHNLKIKKLPISKRPVVGIEDIAKVIERHTGIPLQSLIDSQKKQLLDLEAELKKHIIGQDDAVKELARCIRRGRVGLQNPDRPLGTFLFLGPTGVGKTELTKQLAELVYNDPKALIKFDMSEFSEAHTGSRLIGAPAGYIGYGEGGDLTEKIRRKPYAIVLFDEIEKAHRQVHQLLLQIMENGELTDSKGKKVNFRNTIIIMTSNIGASRFQKTASTIGFQASKDDIHKGLEEYNIIEQDVKKDLKKTFTAEFINRIDATLVFKPLDKTAIDDILTIHINALQERLKALYNIDLQVNNDYRNTILEKSYNPDFGAREVRRTVSEMLEHPLSEALLRGDISENSSVTYPI